MAKLTDLKIKALIEASAAFEGIADGDGRRKHPNIVRSRIEKDSHPHMGKVALDDVKPQHIDTLLQAIVDRGAPTIAMMCSAGFAASSTMASSGIT